MAWKVLVLPPAAAGSICELGSREVVPGACLGLGEREPKLPWSSPPGSEAGSGVVLPPARRLGCWDALARCGADVGRVAGDAFQVPWQPSRSHRARRVPADGCHSSSGGS